MLWIAGAVDAREMYTRASTAKPWTPYREKFLYNNVVYASAGEASARVAGTTWSDLLETRLLDPLGMDATTSDHDAARKDPKRAQGYRWDEEAAEFVPLPMRAVISAAPAGAIFSNVEDMAKWVKFQLAKGEIDGQRLVSVGSLEETQSPQMQMGPTNGYGLGWMLEVRNGKRVVHHGGNIDGYAAMVAMIPDENVGFVLLTNVSTTPLQHASRDLVFGALLDPLTADDDGAPAEDLSAYEGKYIADFATFEDADFTVTQRDGKLFVDVPGQMNFELKEPDAQGRRAFALTDTVKVSFERDETGAVVVLRMHQGGFDFELPKRGWTPEPEVPLDELRPMLGRYDNDELGVAEVALSNNRLAVDVPKQMKYELHPPDESGKRKVRIRPEFAVEFRPSAERLESFVLHQGDEAVEFVRLEATKSKPLPSIDALMKLRKIGRVKKVVRITGKVRMPQAAVEGTVTWTTAPDGRHMADVDFGKFGQVHDLVLHDRAWTRASFAPEQEHRGKYLDQAQAGLPAILLGDWRTLFDEANVTGRSEREGRPILQVELNNGKAPPIRLTLDEKTGDVLTVEQATLHPGAGAIPTTTKLSEYRNVRGVRLPHHIEQRDEASGRTVIDLQSLEVLSDDPDTVFTGKLDG